MAEKLKSSILVLFCLLMFSPSSISSQTKMFKKPSFNAKEIATLEKGKTIFRHLTYRDDNGNWRGKGAAYVYINAPIEVLQNTFMDFEHYAEFLPYVVDTKVIEHKERGDGTFRSVVHHKLHIVISIEYTLIYEGNSRNCSASFKLDPTKPHDIKDASGHYAAWRITDRKTLAMWSVRVDSGMPVPQFIENYLIRRDLPGVIEAFKRRAESGGTWRKK